MYFLYRLRIEGVIKLIGRIPDKKINEISFKLIEDKSILYRHKDIINHNEVDRLVKNGLINDSKEKFIIKYLDEHDRQLCITKIE